MASRRCASITRSIPSSRDNRRAARRRLEVGRLRERPPRLRRLEPLLPKVRHLLPRVPAVELDDLGQRADRRVGAEGGQVGVQVGLELVQQNLGLGPRQGAAGLRQRNGIDDLGAARPHGVDRARQQEVDLLVESGEAARDADARPRQSVGVEIRRVVAQPVRLGVRGGRIPRVGTGQHPQHDRGVAHGARHRSRGVLAVRDRDDAGAADEADRRLDADDAVGRPRADDRPVGLRADRRRNEAGSHRDRRPRARSAGVPVEGVGIAALAAARAPAARRAGRAEVGPFAQVRLADEPGARLAQAPGHEGVLGGNRPPERERPRRGRHPIRGADVVLEKDGDPVQRSAGARGVTRVVEGVRARAVERVGQGARLRVHLDHRAQGRTLPVEGGDAGQAGIGERARGHAAVPHRLPQGVDGDLLDGGRRRRAHRLCDRAGPDRGQRAVAQEVAATDLRGHRRARPLRAR